MVVVAKGVGGGSEMVKGKAGSVRGGLSFVCCGGYAHVRDPANSAGCSSAVINTSVHFPEI